MADRIVDKLEAFRLLDAGAELIDEDGDRWRLHENEVQWRSEYNHVWNDASVVDFLEQDGGFEIVDPEQVVVPDEIEALFQELPEHKVSWMRRYTKELLRAMKEKAYERDF